MDDLSEQRLSDTNPVLAQRVRDLAARLPFAIRVTCGLRSWVQQDQLYSQGRTQAGPKVTNAPGGYSNHNFGLAVDVVPLDVESKPDWNPDHPDWQLIVSQAATVGLRDGISFHDEPHLEPVEINPVPNGEMRQTLKDANVKSVWESVGLVGA